MDMVERIRPRNQRWLQRFRLDMQMVMPALCQVRDVSLFTDREHQSWDASVWISLVDVTDIPGTAEGDECMLFGEQEGEILSVEEVSELAGSFNYEFVCDVGRRVPRVFYQNGKAVETKDYYPEY